MTDSQRHGRILLLTALCIIAALIVNGFMGSVGNSKSDLVSGIVGNGLLVLMLVLAFRGGQLALKLTKGFALLFAVLVAVLVVVIVGSFVRGIPLPQTPTVGNTIPFTATVVGVGFSVWALFLSHAVKDFIACQREQAHQRQLARIKRSRA
jgi:hypothetical protein